MADGFSFRPTVFTAYDHSPIVKEFSGAADEFIKQQKKKDDAEAFAKALELTTGGATAPVAPAPAIPSPVPPVGPTADAADPIAAYRAAIQKNESGGNYAAIGPATKTGDKAYGAYQVMGANIPSWTAEALGKPLTPEQFVADPKAQDAVFDYHFGKSLQKYGNPQDAASVWFTGKPASEGAGRRDILGTTGQDYVAKFNASLPQGVTQQSAALNSDPAALPPNAQPAEFVVPGTAAAGPQPAAAPQKPAATSSMAQQPVPSASAGGSVIDPQTKARILALSKNEATRPLAMEMLKQVWGGKELTNNLKEYGQAQREGFKGNFLEYITKVKEAGSTKVIQNVDQKGETENSKVVGKGYGEFLLETQKEGRAAQGQVNTLRLMEKIVDQPNFYSGAGVGLVNTARRAAASLGVVNADTLAPNELFSALSKRTIIDNLGSLGSGISNADVSFATATGANQEVTPEGNRRIIQVGKALAQRKIEVAQEARKYAKAHGGRLDAGFDDTLTEWAEKHPLFPEQTKIEQQNATQPAPKAAPSAPVRVTTPDEARKLPKGTAIILPDGSQGVVP